MSIFSTDRMIDLHRTINKIIKTPFLFIAGKILNFMHKHFPRLTERVHHAPIARDYVLHLPENNEEPDNLPVNAVEEEHAPIARDHIPHLAENNEEPDNLPVNVAEEEHAPTARDHILRLAENNEASDNLPVGTVEGEEEDEWFDAEGELKEEDEWFDAEGDPEEENGRLNVGTDLGEEWCIAERIDHDAEPVVIREENVDDRQQENVPITVPSLIREHLARPLVSPFRVSVDDYVTPDEEICRQAELHQAVALDMDDILSWLLPEDISLHVAENGGTIRSDRPRIKKANPDCLAEEIKRHISDEKCGVRLELDREIPYTWGKTDAGETMLRFEGGIRLHGYVDKSTAYRFIDTLSSQKLPWGTAGVAAFTVKSLFAAYAGKRGLTATAHINGIVIPPDGVPRVDLTFASEGVAMQEGMPHVGSVCAKRIPGALETLGAKNIRKPVLSSYRQDDPFCALLRYAQWIS
ncbi:MAG: hypothetical protein OXF02_00130 [Simkaniaceae bacterium]|nr:hypothetical protein [Simkaniaceae bacterium]